MIKMKDDKKLKVIVSLTFIVIIIILIFAIKLTFFNKNEKNTEINSNSNIHQIDEDEKEIIDETIDKDETLKEEDKETMSTEEKDNYLKGENVGEIANALVIGNPNGPEYDETNSNALYKELIKLAETASYLDIIDRVDSLTSNYYFSKDYNLRIANVYLDSKIMINIKENSESLELGQKGYMVANSKDPYMILIDTLMLHERERRNVIKEVSSLSPMFEGAVRIEDTKVYNFSNRDEDTQAKIIFDNELSIKELYQIDFKVETYPLTAYVVRYGNGAISLKTIITRGNTENPFKPISYWMNLDKVIYRE